MYITASDAMPVHLRLGYVQRLYTRTMPDNKATALTNHLADDLTGVIRLHGISARLSASGGLQHLLEEIVGVGAASMPGKFTAIGIFRGYVFHL
jgi:hypothetical protein